MLDLILGPIGQIAGVLLVAGLAALRLIGMGKKQARDQMNEEDARQADEIRKKVEKVDENLTDVSDDDLDRRLREIRRKQDS